MGLYLGLVGFGVSLALMVRARLGLGPWDVLHQGIARHLGVRLGWWVTTAVSGLVEQGLVVSAPTLTAVAVVGAAPAGG